MADEALPGMDAFEEHEDTSLTPGDKAEVLTRARPEKPVEPYDADASAAAASAFQSRLPAAQPNATPAPDPWANFSNADPNDPWASFSNTPPDQGNVALALRDQDIAAEQDRQTVDSTMRVLGAFGHGFASGVDAGAIIPMDQWGLGPASNKMLRDVDVYGEKGSRTWMQAFNEAFLIPNVVELAQFGGKVLQAGVIQTPMAILGGGLAATEAALGRETAGTLEGVIMSMPILSSMRPVAGPLRTRTFSRETAEGILREPIEPSTPGPAETIMRAPITEPAAMPDAVWTVGGNRVPVTLQGAPERAPTGEPVVRIRLEDGEDRWVPLTDVIEREAPPLAEAPPREPSRTGLVPTRVEAPGPVLPGEPPHTIQQWVPGEPLSSDLPVAAVVEHADRTGVLGDNPTTPEAEAAPPFDGGATTPPVQTVHDVARSLAPDVFPEYDRLSAELDQARQELNAERERLRAEAAQEAERQRPHAEEVADLKEALADPRTSARRRRTAQARLDEILAEHDEFADHEDVMAFLARPTPELLALQRRVMALDEQMRDMAPAVSAAYREAERLMPARNLDSRDRPIQNISAVAPDSVRFFHGGPPEQSLPPTTGGKRWVSPDYRYARDYRSQEGNPGAVWYVDIPKGHPDEVAAFDDVNNFHRSTEVSEETAKGFKPYNEAAVEAEKYHNEVRSAEAPPAAPSMEATALAPEHLAVLDAIEDGNEPTSAQLPAFRLLRTLGLVDVRGDGEAFVTDKGIVARDRARGRLPTTAPTEPPMDIAAHVTERLVKAGRPVDESNAMAALVQAYYETKAARFGGRLGTAEDIYRAEAPEIAAGGDRGKAAGTFTRVNGKSVLTLFRRADPSTAIHEFGHHWFNDLLRDAANKDAPANLRVDAAVVRRWLNVEEGQPLTRAHQERVARAFETYMMEGHAPSKALGRVFEQFKEWMTKVYETVKQQKVELNDDLRGVFDRWFTEAPEPRAAVEAPERAGPPPAPRGIGTIMRDERVRQSVARQIQSQEIIAYAEWQAANRNPGTLATPPPAAPVVPGERPRTPRSVAQIIAEDRVGPVRAAQVQGEEFEALAAWQAAQRAQGRTPAAERPAAPPPPVEPTPRPAEPVRTEAPPPETPAPAAPAEGSSGGSTVAPLRAALRRARRASDLAGQLEHDPVARSLLALPGDDLNRVGGALRAAGIKTLEPLNAGVSTIVLDAGDGRVVHVGLGPAKARPAIPEVLQAELTGQIGRVGYEVLPKVDRTGITEADVTAMNDTLKAKGFRFSDPRAENLGRTADGTIVVTDSGAITELGPEAKPRPVKPKPTAVYMRVPKEPRQLSTFIREGVVTNKGTPFESKQFGKLKDAGGSLAAALGDPRLIKKYIDNEKGEPLDLFGRRAADEGYFNGIEPESDSALIDRIVADIEGHAQYSMYDADAAQSHHDAIAFNEQVTRLAAKHDIDPRGMTRDAFFKAIEDKVGKEEFDAQAEVERARAMDDANEMRDDLQHWEDNEAEHAERLNPEDFERIWDETPVTEELVDREQGNAEPGVPGGSESAGTQGAGSERGGAGHAGSPGEAGITRGPEQTGTGTGGTGGESGGAAKPEPLPPIGTNDTLTEATRRREDSLPKIRNLRVEYLDEAGLDDTLRQIVGELNVSGDPKSRGGDMFSALHVLLNEASKKYDAAATKLLEAPNADNYLAYQESRQQWAMAHARLESMSEQWGYQGYIMGKIVREGARIRNEIQALGDTDTLELFQVQREIAAVRALNTPEQGARLIRDNIVRRETWLQKVEAPFLTYYLSQILSNVVTHGGYLIGSHIMNMFKIASIGAEASYGAARSLLPGAMEQRVYFGEIPAAIFGSSWGFVQGIVPAWRAFKTGDVLMRGISEIPLSQPQVLPKMLGAGYTLEMPLRMINAQHVQAYSTAFTGELARIAYRETMHDMNWRDATFQKFGAQIQSFINQPPDWARQLAHDEALQTVLMKPPRPGTIRSQMTAMVRNTPGLSFIAPFMNIGNLMIEQGPIRSTPLAFASAQVRSQLRGEIPGTGVSDMGRQVRLLREDAARYLAAGDTLRAEQIELNAAELNRQVKAGEYEPRKSGAMIDRAMGRMISGSVLGLTTAWLASQGTITGPGPDMNTQKGRDEGRVWRDEQKAPFAAKIGDMWVPYLKVGGALGMLMGLSTTFSQAAREMTDGERKEAAVTIAAGVNDAVIHEMWFRTLHDIVTGVMAGGPGLDVALRNFAAGWIPFSSGLAGATKQIDPYQRRVEGVLDAMQAKIPFLSEKLPPKIGIWGTPDIGHSQMGFWHQRNDPVNARLMALGVGVADFPKELSGIPMDEQERRQYGIMAGTLAHRILTDIVADPEFARSAPGYQIKKIAAVIHASREQAAKVVQSGNYEKFITGGQALHELMKVVGTEAAKRRMREGGIERVIGDLRRLSQ